MFIIPADMRYEDEPDWEKMPWAPFWMDGYVAGLEVHRYGRRPALALNNPLNEIAQDWGDEFKKFKLGEEIRQTPDSHRILREKGTLWLWKEGVWVPNCVELYEGGERLVVAKILVIASGLVNRDRLLSWGIDGQRCEVLLATVEDRRNDFIPFTFLRVNAGGCR